MIRALRLALVAGLAFPAIASAQAVQYRAADNINNIPVSAATPLPVTSAGGGGAGTQAAPDVVSGVNATNTVPTNLPTNTLNAGIVPVVQGASSAGQVICTGPCNVYRVDGVAPAAGHVCVENSVTVQSGALTMGTASGNVQRDFQVLAAGSWGFEFKVPERYSVGASYAYSSTACSTVTLAASTAMEAQRAQ